MENLISKELLSEVLRLDICKITIKNNILEYDADFDDTIDVKNINIYELAYKCKEWAYKLGYEVVQLSHSIKIYKNSYEAFNESSFKIYDLDLFFKTCQWILDNEVQNER